MGYLVTKLSVIKTSSQRYKTKNRKEKSTMYCSVPPRKVERRGSSSANLNVVLDSSSSNQNQNQQQSSSSSNPSSAAARGRSQQLRPLETSTVDVAASSS